MQATHDGAEDSILLESEQLCNTAVDVCHEHQINEQTLNRWKREFEMFDPVEFKALFQGYTRGLAGCKPQLRSSEPWQSMASAFADRSRSRPRQRGEHGQRVVQPAEHHAGPD